MAKDKKACVLIFIIPFYYDIWQKVWENIKNNNGKNKFWYSCEIMKGSISKDSSVNLDKINLNIMKGKPKINNENILSVIFEINNDCLILLNEEWSIDSNEKNVIKIVKYILMKHKKCEFYIAAHNAKIPTEIKVNEVSILNITGFSHSDTDSIYGVLKNNLDKNEIRELIIDTTKMIEKRVKIRIITEVQQKIFYLFLPVDIKWRILSKIILPKDSEKLELLAKETPFSTDLSEKFETLEKITSSLLDKYENNNIKEYYKKLGINFKNENSYIKKWFIAFENIYKLEEDVDESLRKTRKIWKELKKDLEIKQFSDWIANLIQSLNELKKDKNE